MSGAENAAAVPACDRSPSCGCPTCVLASDTEFVKLAKVLVKAKAQLAREGVPRDEAIDRIKGYIRKAHVAIRDSGDGYWVPSEDAFAATVDRVMGFVYPEPREAAIERATP